MIDWLFYFFAALALVAGMAVVIQRNPVHAAMNLVLCFIGLAGLFVLLEAFFLAFVQIAVYAGAIVVLFLFIIMLIDAEKAPAPGTVSLAASLMGFLLLATLLGYTLAHPAVDGFAPAVPSAAFAEGVAPGARVANYGKALFVEYQLAFQVTGVLLLMAMIGVIAIAKKQAPDSPTEKIETEVSA